MTEPNQLKLSCATPVSFELGALTLPSARLKKAIMLSITVPESKPSCLALDNVVRLYYDSINHILK